VETCEGGVLRCKGGVQHVGGARARYGLGSARMRGPQVTDGRLARRAAAGDERAFAELCERHGQRLYGYIQFHHLSNPEDAADALQQTLLKAWKGLPSWRGDGDIVGWLFRIARNEAVSLKRAERPVLALADDVPQRGELHEQIQVRADARRLLADIAALPETQREALIMRELTGLGYGEIAKALTSSPTAARVAVCDAREALRESASAQAMPCRAIRDRISDGDGRRLLSRSIRAHMRSCDACRTYAAQLQDRPKQLRALTTPLPAGLLARALTHALGGSVPASATSLGASASSTGLAKGTMSSAAIKLAALGCAAAGLGVGGAIVVDSQQTPSRRARASTETVIATGSTAVRRSNALAGGPSRREASPATPVTGTTSASNPVPSTTSTPSSAPTLAASTRSVSTPTAAVGVTGVTGVSGVSGLQVPATTGLSGLITTQPLPAQTAPTASLPSGTTLPAVPSVP